MRSTSGACSASMADSVRQWLELDKQCQAPRSDNMPRLTWKQSAAQLTKVVLDGHGQPARTLNHRKGEISVGSVGVELSQLSEGNKGDMTMTEIEESQGIIDSAAGRPGVETSLRPGVSRIA